MTIQEIRDMVAKKIAGQGTMVDVGGGLPAILNAICDAIEGVSPKVVTSGNNWDELRDGQYGTKALLASALSIPESSVDDLQSCDELKLTDISLRRTIAMGAGEGFVLFGGTDGAYNYGYSVIVSGFISGAYTIEKYEI